MTIRNKHTDVQSESNEKQGGIAQDDHLSVEQENPGQVQAHVKDECGEESPRQKCWVAVDRLVIDFSK
jgi:hypothetical protein